MPSYDQQVKSLYRNNVLKLRLRLGYKTQKDFAATLGVCPGLLCDVESNRRFLTSSLALRISEVTGCSLDELYIKKGVSGVATEHR
jgi:DNA-binding XRE family transcriptional regulator